MVLSVKTQKPISGKSPRQLRSFEVLVLIPLSGRLNILIPFLILA